MRDRWCAGVLMLALMAVAGPARAEGLRPDRDDLRIVRDTTLAPGTYTVGDGNRNGVIWIAADNVTLDLGQATLVGSPAGTDADQMSGIGIMVDGRSGVRIKGGAVRGFKVAIYARRCTGLVIEGVDVGGNYCQRLQSTPAAEHAADWLRPHDNDRNEWIQRYGAGIAIDDGTAPTVRRCRARRGQNGLLLTRCTKAVVNDNDFSYLSGWGVALYRTRDSVISHNRVDYCLRGYSHGVYHRGQDSAAILVFEQSSRNVIAFNSGTHSGDGLFLYAGQDTVKGTGDGGCNDNLVYRNDFSYAVANGIEATFSGRNRFIENRLDGCDYGVWGGYSYDSVIAGNTISGCLTAGVAIEHGQDWKLVGNRFSGNRVAVKLWWDNDRELLASPFGRKRGGASTRYELRANHFQRDAVAVRLETTSELTGVGNAFSSVGQRLTQAGNCPGVQLTRDVEPGALEAWTTHVRFTAPTLPGNPTQAPAVPRRGRETMLVDGWGPYDYRSLRVHPARPYVQQQTTIQLMGPATPFVIEGAPDWLDVVPGRGTLPARLTLRPRAESVGYLRRFSLTVVVGERRMAIVGHALQARWQVRHWRWTVDPRRSEAAWARLTSTKPVVEKTVDRLDFYWQNGGPAGVGSDYFATAATTRIRLAAGRYRISTLSDDGVRVFLDRVQVLWNWTHHGPQWDHEIVTVREGAHDLLVEHFEILGFSALKFRIEPLAPR